jgi:hypothetical protein
MGRSATTRTKMEGSCISQRYGKWALGLEGACDSQFFTVSDDAAAQWENHSHGSPVCDGSSWVPTEREVSGGLRAEENVLHSVYSAQRVRRMKEKKKTLG